MAAPREYPNFPEAMTSPNSWDWQSQNLISTGLHFAAEWPTSPAQTHSESGSFGPETTADPLPRWLVDKILQLVDSMPDSTPAWRDHIAKALLEQHLQSIRQNCSCGGQHSGAASGFGSNCWACRTKSASKSMLGSIRRALSNAASSANKRLRMPRKYSGRHRRAPPTALPRWYDPVFPFAPQGGENSSTNSSTDSYGPASSVYKVPLDYSEVELPSEPKAICELQGSTVSDLLSTQPPYGTQSFQTFLERSSHQAPLPHAPVPVHSTYERAYSGHSVSTNSDRSVSMMTDASMHIRGTPSLVSNLSQSTLSSGLHPLSTNVGRIDHDKDLVDSPATMDGEVDTREVAPWDIGRAPQKQVSRNSTSTAADYPLVRMETSEDEWLNPEPSSDGIPLPISAEELLLELDQLAPLPPPYSPTELTWDEPPAYSPSSVSRRSRGFGTRVDSRVFPGVRLPVLQAVSQPQPPIMYPLSFHSQGGLASSPPASIRAEVNPYFSPPSSRYLPGLAPSPVATRRSVPPAWRPPVPAANRRSVVAPAGRSPQQPSSPDLPSVRKASVARRTSLRRRRNNRARRRPTLQPTFCEVCQFFPTGPGVLKKMRKHSETDKHRRAMNQGLVDRVICQHVGEDGSVCGKRFNRGDNLVQHRRLHELADADDLSEDDPMLIADHEVLSGGGLPRIDEWSCPDGS